MKKKKSKIILGIVLIIMLFVLLRPIKDWLRGYFEVTSYPVGQMEDGSYTLPLNRTVYRIYPKESRGIYWMPWVKASPEPLVDCVIRDRCNWACSYPDRAGREVRMGGCMEENMLDTEWYRPVSAFVWWKYHLGLK